MFFVVFSAPAFDEFRQQLTPLFPEHGGWGVFDPVALRPVLTIAATDREFGIRWPLAVEQQHRLPGFSANQLTSKTANSTALGRRTRR